MEHLFSIRLFSILFCAGAFCSGCSQGNKSHGTMRGNDGKIYKTVKIGNQVWMAENLRETKYRNGSEIPSVSDDNRWGLLSTGGRCVFDNGESNADIYGYLYNWYAVDDHRNIAPPGWRVPSDDDWKELERHLGMNHFVANELRMRGSPVGSKLAGGINLWDSGALKNHSEIATSGFSALPGGQLNSYFDYFLNLGYDAYFWSAAENSAHHAWFRHLSCFQSALYRGGCSKQYGFSLRLLRD